MKFLPPCLCLFCGFISLGTLAQDQAPVVTTTNATIRVMASNLTSGNNSRYEVFGLRILKGLAPDVVAMQEFNYVSTNGLGTNTPGAFREMVDGAFGTNFSYFRENITMNGPIPNGIISRFPILSSGSFPDIVQTQPNRGFAWAEIGIPGSNSLYVVSVHLLTSSSVNRSNETVNLKALMATANFPTNGFVVVAGDFNAGTRGEACITNFRPLLVDDPIPTDQAGNSFTSGPRSTPHDFVLISPLLRSNFIATVIGAQSFTNGLVFDSRVYMPLSDVPPVVSTDSGASMMQHMGVVKDFRINYTVTNFVTVPPPVLILNATNVIRWQGLSNVTYSVQASTNLPFFSTIGTALSTTTNLSFTNTSGSDHLFYRVVYP
ncbi:MAG: endonuclease/exonuclease/phosphatase family protein [Verrucomicrobiota bacterium]